MSYQSDWRDTARHLANACFVGSYLSMTRGMLISGALFTIVGELLLAPSAFKHRSWSTVFVGGLFLLIALSTLATGLLGGN